MTTALVQMIAALGLVVGLIFGIAFVYRKRAKSTGIVSLLSYQSLGQKVGIAAVKIGDEVLVLGITPTDFKLLRKIDAAGQVMRAEDGSAERLQKLRKIREAI